MNYRNEDKRMCTGILLLERLFGIVTALTAVFRTCHHDLVNMSVFFCVLLAILLKFENISPNERSLRGKRNNYVWLIR